MNRWLTQGVPAGRTVGMRADSKHSPAAHYDFACGRSGPLSCNGGGNGTPQAPRCTERSSSHDARLSVCTYLHTRAIGEIGAAVGLGGLVSSIPVWVQCTPRGQLPTSRSLPPSTLCGRRLVSSTSCSPLSISLSFSDFLSVPFVTISCSHPLSPLPFFSSPSTYSSICLCWSLLFSSRLVNRAESRGVRRSKVEGMKSGCERAGIPRGRKEENSLRMVMVRRRSGWDVLGAEKRGRS